MVGTAHRRTGYTLVELLIVIAILVTVVGLSIPTIGRIGGFLGDQRDEAARELYGILRAARVYATAFRVDTAVVYTLDVRQPFAVDNPSQPGVFADPGVNPSTGTAVVITGYGIARRMTPDEQALLTDCLGYPDTVADRAYVMVQGHGAQVRFMPRDTCMQPLGFFGQAGCLRFEDDPDRPGGPAIEWFASTETEFRADLLCKGMQEVYVFDYGDVYNSACAPGSAIAGFLPVNILSTPAQFAASVFDTDVPNPMDRNQLNLFPAHVFSATGAMKPFDSEWARLVLYVMTPPDGPVDERFTVGPDDNDPNYPSGLLKAPHRVELYPPTGRVKITS